MHKLDSSRHHSHAVLVVSLPAFQPAHFGLSIEVRSRGANHLNRAHTVSNGHYFFLTDSLLAGPGAPLPLHRASGIDENSVEIEQNRGAAESGHFFFLSQRALAGGRRQNLRSRRRQSRLGLLAEL